MQRFRTPLAIMMALLLSNAIILYTTSDIRFVAALILMFLLPGAAWLPLAHNWLATEDPLERLTMLVGGSSVLTAFALFVALMLPGPFTETPVLVALNLLILGGVAGQLWRPPPSMPLQWPRRSILLLLLMIVAVATFTRLVRLDYAEFHEDELENMRLIVRAYKGEEYAQFLDSKGPIHWILPAGMWYLNGWLSEAVARSPFVITSVMLIPLMFLFGRRLGGNPIGLLAATFVGLNGFFVAYARFVENQSLIVLWGSMAIWWAYRYYLEGRAWLLLYSAFALAIGLIAHPDVLLYLPVIGLVSGYSLWRWRHNGDGRVALGWAMAAGVLFISLSAMFYVPYLTDPQIGLVYQYLANDRIGESFLYNQVLTMFEQDRLYSTRYHGPLLTMLFLWLVGRRFWQAGRAFGGLFLLLTMLMGSTLIWPGAWQIGTINFAFAPYALLTLVGLLLPGAPFEFRMLLMWMMAPLGALLFLAQDAADHVQVAYPAWALLAAMGLHDFWHWLNRLPAPRRRVAHAAVVISLIVVGGLILFYQYLTFGSPVRHYWQAHLSAEQQPQALYNWLYGGIARPRKLFSNPRVGGWKTVGYLWETGVLHGDFRSINESFAVPIWYTFQTPRSCYEDPQNYWVRRSHNGWPEEAEQVVAQGYHLTRVVLVDGLPKLRLYEKNRAVAEPEILDSTAYQARFNRLATPSRFAQGEPIEQPRSLNFADKLLLRGFNLPATTMVIEEPGELLPVTLFWQALSPMETRYRAFVHLVDEAGQRWGQHDDDPACRLLTTEMRPGQLSARQFRLPLNPETPPGEYQLIMGLYHPETMAPLPIWDNWAGESPGAQYWLGTVQVQAE